MKVMLKLYTTEATKLASASELKEFNGVEELYEFVDAELSSVKKFVATYKQNNLIGIVTLNRAAGNFKIMFLNDDAQLAHPPIEMRFNQNAISFEGMAISFMESIKDMIRSIEIYK